MSQSPILSVGAALCFALALPGQTREKRVTPLDAGALQSFEKQPKIAVLVGIGAYPEGSGLSTLKYAASDVAELASELEKEGYAVRQLTEAQATRGVILRTLNQIGQVLDPDRGTLLFYFSGHGFAQGGINYLATYGVTVDDLQREGLSLTEVEQTLKRSRAKRQVLWIDACRNDSQSGARDVSRRTFARLDAAEGLRVLYSTRAGSVSYEDDSLRHGVFTYFLLRGLRGEAAGTDGLVTFQDLTGYVSESVMSYGVKTGRVQRPFEAGEASGDFLLAKAASAGSAPPPSPTEKPIPVGGNVQAANLIKKVSPAYPPLAKASRVQGTVRFNAIIARDGTVEDLQLVSGHPFLVSAATEAVKQWIYRPTLLEGKPVEVVTQIDVNFTLSP